MAYNENGIKVSARVPKGLNINARKILEQACAGLNESEFGGHESAGGCVINKDEENIFIEKVKSILAQIKSKLSVNGK